MWKNICLLLTTIIIGLSAFIYFKGASHTPPKLAPPSFSTKEIIAPKGKIRADIADTEFKQEMVFASHKNILSNQGILLTYNYMQAQNNLIEWLGIIPIDLVWIDAEKKVFFVQSNILSRLTHSECTVYYSPKPMPYVLLLQAGAARSLGIVKGVKLTFDFSDPIIPKENIHYSTVTVTAPKGNIAAQVADTDYKSNLGLGDRDSLPQGKGMIFVFKTPDIGEIWMKDMRFPLDVIWLDANKKVIFVKANFSPESYKDDQALIYFSPKPTALYVLEIPAGDAERLGITNGIRLAFNLGT